MELINNRNCRTSKRKTTKNMIDNKISLAVDINNEKLPLLSEGVILYADETPQYYILKGTLQKAYDSLDENISLHIGIGHCDFANFPDRIVGEFKKKDLSIEYDENGRATLYVSPMWYEENYLYKTIINQPFKTGLSAEFYATLEDFEKGKVVNDMLNRDYDGVYVSTYDTIDLIGCGVVGECGDVNCSDSMNNMSDVALSIMGVEDLDTIGDVADLTDEEIEKETKELDEGLKNLSDMINSFSIKLSELEKDMNALLNESETAETKEVEETEETEEIKETEEIEETKETEEIKETEETEEIVEVENAEIIEEECTVIENGVDDKFPKINFNDEVKLSSTSKRKFGLI